MLEHPYLVVGLGNPGKGYAKTRHNVGFCAVEELARKKGASFHKGKGGLCGLLAEYTEGGRRVLLLKPETYMNSSGEAVRALVFYYKIPYQNLCVVCDDIYLPFGTLRLKGIGGSGGHNGLKSISSHLGSEAYPRLRIGVGDRKEGDLADYVLSPFTVEEQEKMPSLLQQAVVVVETWVNEGIIQAVQQAHACQKQKLGEEEDGDKRTHASV